MPGPIVPITLPNAAAVSSPAAAAPSHATEGDANLFRSIFQSAVQTVDASQAQASKAVEDFLTGQNEDIHSAMLATQRADLTFEMFMQVRNKVIAAYQEIMKMQV